MSVIKLYVDTQYSSPYAMSVFVALSEKQLPFEMVVVDLFHEENLKPAFTKLSLTSKVPVLQHGDFLLSESSAIDEYIDEVFPGKKLYPSSVQQKARARQIQAWLRSDLMPIREERPTEAVFYERATAQLSRSAEQTCEKLFFVANTLLEENSSYLFGDWCIADAELALMLNRLIFNGDYVPENLRKYALYQWQRPSVQAWANLVRPALHLKK